MSNGIVNEFKRVILSGFVCITSLSVDSSEYYVTVTDKPMALYLSSVVLIPQLDNSKVPKWIAYFVIWL